MSCTRRPRVGDLDEVVNGKTSCRRVCSRDVAGAHVYGTSGLRGNGRHPVDRGDRDSTECPIITAERSALQTAARRRDRALELGRRACPWARCRTLLLGNIVADRKEATATDFSQRAVKLKCGRGCARQKRWPGLLLRAYLLSAFTGVRKYAER